MAFPSSLKPPNSLHIFSMKPPTTSSSSSSSLISIKLKTLFQTFIHSQMYRIFRPLAKAKSLLLDLLDDIHLVELPLLKKTKKKKLLFGSFRLHYNWCSSSHVMPLAHEPNSHIYYDASWNTVVPTAAFPTTMLERHDQTEEPEELSRYLEWLEEKKHQEDSRRCNEIDELADLFIADCHEKFRLEKQESYRRFQEMLARSV